MTTPDRHIRPTERRINPSMIALGVIGFLALASAFFFLGLGPLAKLLMSRTSHPVQTVHSPMPSLPNEGTRKAPAAADAKSSLDLQITEEGDSQKSDESTETPASDSTSEGDTITITLDPGNQQKEQSSVSQTDDKDSNADVPRPKRTEDKPKAEPAAPTASAPTAHGNTATSSSKTGYRVQAGTFANKSNAEKLASDLQRRGYSPNVMGVQSEAGTLYRVEVGQYKTRQGAQDLADELTDRGYSPSVHANR